MFRLIAMLGLNLKVVPRESESSRSIDEALQPWTWCRQRLVPGVHTAGVIYLDVIVIGHPRAQTRPRTFRNGGVQTDSDACATWKATVIAALIASDANPVPAGTALELEIQFAMPTAQRSRVGKHATSRPDADNLLKAASDSLMPAAGRGVKTTLRAVCGGLQWAGLIDDDASITDIIVRKRWSTAPGGHG